MTTWSIYLFLTGFYLFQCQYFQYESSVHWKEISRDKSENRLSYALLTILLTLYVIVEELQFQLIQNR